MKLIKNIFLKLSAKGFFNYMNDKLYLKIFYRQIFNERLNLDNPQTFNEKLQWLKLYDRKPIYVIMVDKYEVKKYVSNIIGDEYIIPTLGIWDNFDDIEFDKLPEQFVLKCTHDSGGIVICKDKKNLNIKEAKRKIEKSLKRNYYYYTREWPYKNVKPRIIAEKFISDDSKEELLDYKIMCFNGKAEYSFVCSERHSNGLKIDFYDLNWKKMPFKRHYPNSDRKLEKPLNYNLMIELAERLSQNTTFLRVDFYEVNGKTYFGELTFFPGSGFEEFSPKEWDRKLGELIDLSLLKSSEKLDNGEMNEK